MSNFSFTCKICAKTNAMNISDENFRKVWDLLEGGIFNIPDEDRETAFAIRSMHVDCFDKAFSDNKDSFKAGSYVSESIFDEDEYRDVFVFHYVHKVEGNMAEVWTINNSSRYVRKGGEFITKTNILVDEAISYMLAGFPNTASKEDLREVLTTHVKQERKAFVSAIVEAETDSLIGDVFSGYETVSLIEDHAEFLKDCEIIENNLYRAEVFGAK